MPAGGVLCLDGDHQVGDDLPAVAHDGHVGGAVLGDLGWVDVGVDDSGLWGECGQFPGDPVVEASTQRNDQVRALQRGDGRDVAVHARHPEVRRSLSGNAPRAVSVVTTGIPVSSTSRRSSAEAPALITPPPT